MEKKPSRKGKKHRTVDEFERDYLPKLHQRKLFEEESDDESVFAQHLATSFLNNIREELRR